MFRHRNEFSVEGMLPTFEGATAWLNSRALTLEDLAGRVVLASFGTYPPYARPPLVYLYYTALGSGQDFGHGSAGAVILTLIIAVIAVVQGRVLRLGDRGD